MSKRLQVLFDETEMDAVRDAARRQGVPVSEWVRGALRQRRDREGRGNLHSKLRAVRAAARHDFPTADVGDMLAEIERGYAGPGAHGIG